MVDIYLNMQYLTFLFFLIFCSSCYYDNEEYLYPFEERCDTTFVTYPLNIKPIMINYCISCHSNSKAATLGGNIQLDTYQEVAKRAEDGSLNGSISYQNDYSPMPPKHELDKCDVAALRTWIKLGFKEK